MTIQKGLIGNSFITTVHNDNSIQIMKATTFDFEEPIIISG